MKTQMEGVYGMTKQWTSVAIIYQVSRLHSDLFLTSWMQDYEGNVGVESPVATTSRSAQEVEGEAGQTEEKLFGADLSQRAKVHNASFHCLSTNITAKSLATLSHVRCMQGS